MKTSTGLKLVFLLAVVMLIVGLSFVFLQEYNKDTNSVPPTTTTTTVLEAEQCRFRPGKGYTIGGRYDGTPCAPQ